MNYYRGDIIKMGKLAILGGKPVGKINMPEWPVSD